MQWSRVYNEHVVRKSGHTRDGTDNSQRVLFDWQVVYYIWIKVVELGMPTKRCCGYEPYRFGQRWDQKASQRFFRNRFFFLFQLHQLAWPVVNNAWTTAAHQTRCQWENVALKYYSAIAVDELRYSRITPQRAPIRRPLRVRNKRTAAIEKYDAHLCKGLQSTREYTTPASTG